MTEAEKTVLRVAHKTCSTCRWYDGNHSCLRKPKVVVDKVSGRVLEETKSCTDEREVIVGFDILQFACGFRGRYWMAKEEVMSLRERAQVARQS